MLSRLGKTSTAPLDDLPEEVPQNTHEGGIKLRVIGLGCYGRREGFCSVSCPKIVVSYVFFPTTAFCGRVASKTCCKAADQSVRGVIGITVTSCVKRRKGQLITP